MKKLIPKIIGVYFNVITYVFPKMIRDQAFKILCIVKPLKLSEDAETFSNQGALTYLSTDLGDAALHTWGNGPKKILFLHGWQSHSYRWKPYIDQLDLNEYTVYSIDAPGHGYGKGNQLNIEVYRQALTQAIRQVKKIDVLVSHSFGGLVTGYAFLENKGLPVEKYIIMGTPVGMDVIFEYSKKMLGLSNRMINQILLKANEILKIPISEIEMKHFFVNTNAPILIVHDHQDDVTPIKPILAVIPQNNLINTYFTTNQGHTLKDPTTVAKVISYIKQENHQEVCI